MIKWWETVSYISASLWSSWIWVFKHTAEAAEAGQEKQERSYGSLMMEQLTGSEEGRIDHVLQVCCLTYCVFVFFCVGWMMFYEYMLTSHCLHNGILSYFKLLLFAAQNLSTFCFVWRFFTFCICGEIFIYVTLSGKHAWKLMWI